MSKYGILILLRLSVNFTLNKGMSQNLNKSKDKGNFFIKLNFIYLCRSKDYFHIGGKVYGNYS